MKTAMERKAYRVMVTGKFDAVGYTTLLKALDRTGEVVDTYYSKLRKKLPAAATFMVDSDRNDAQLEKLLRRVSGVDTVIVESNHA